MKTFSKTVAIITAIELFAPQALGQIYVPDFKSLEGPPMSKPGDFSNPVPVLPSPPDTMSSGPQYVSPPVGVDSSVSNCHSAGCVGVGREGYYSSTTSTWDGGSSTHVYPPTGDQYQVVCNAGLCQTFGR
jgi:hypothetical protein